MAPWWEIILRILVAGAVGGLIGWERELEQKPAGFRTLTMVSAAVAIYVLAATQFAASHGEPIDAVRAMSGVAQGIGFLGAGAILQSRGQIRWITTAAAIWAVAGLGLAAALGMYLIALFGALLCFATLHWMTAVEARIIPKKRNHLARNGSKEE